MNRHQQISFTNNCVLTDVNVIELKYIFSLLAFSILSTSCKKDGNSNEDRAMLLGSWELSKVYGGSDPEDIYAPGNGNILKFTAERYEQLVKFDLMMSGTYQLSKDSVSTRVSPDSSLYQVADKICLGIAPPDCHLIKIDGNMLIIDFAAPDAGGRAKLYLRND